MLLLTGMLTAACSHKTNINFFELFLACDCVYACVVDVFTTVRFVLVLELKQSL